MGTRVISKNNTIKGYEELLPAISQSQIEKLSFETVASAELASFLPGEICAVLENGRDYQFDASSSEVRDGDLYLNTDGGGRLVATKGTVHVDEVHLAGKGSLSDPVRHSQNTDDLFRFFVGAIISEYSAECLITSNGSTVTASVQSVGGGDIKYVTTDGYATLDCTPAATVVLSVGTDSAPVTNWIYIDVNDGLLKKSTTGFPSSPYVPIDKRLIPSASFVQSYGTYPGNNFADHVYSAGDNGHLTHINQNFRLRPPVYMSGALTTIAGSGTATCTVAVASGEILLNHLRTTYPFADGSNLLVANDQTTPYQIISNLYNLTTDTAGATLTGRWAAHSIWYGHAQESSGAKLFINKPSGTYLSADETRSDTNGYFNSAVPPAFRGCAIGLRRVVARRSATGTIEINYKTSDDWRGKPLSAVPGSGGTTSFSSIFPTSDFRLEDTTDASKEIAFSASAIATGQTRTISMPDRNVDLALASREASTAQSGLASAAHITALQTGIVGAKVQVYTPSAVWTSTRTITEITGSSITYTPKYADSLVEYEFTFVATSTSAAGTLHIRHQIDIGSGFLDVSGNFCTLYRDYTDSEDQFAVKFAAESWGLTAATLRLAARDYSSSDVMVLHRVDSKDGAASTELQKAICKITEIR